MSEEYRQIYDPMANAISTTMIQRVSDGAFIPIDPDNTDYQAFMKWQMEGGMIGPPLSAPSPPIAEVPEPDIREVNAQVQDIDERLKALETQVSNVEQVVTAQIEVARRGS